MTKRNLVMEKKQLIIIPPMSEAVTKLHEVLEGISTDENMEISLIDDLKEFSQFLGVTGQCLILISNAKKCANLLQENRATLLKHSCKTILFTPKEIPAKTLVKFTKIGLTESILESTPPKTFLYKVKLLMRSIKGKKSEEEVENVVKSLDGAKTDESTEGQLDLKKETKEESLLEEVITKEKKEKKEKKEGETLDYGGSLKGKIKPLEENLDTHWKSDRKKTFSDAFDEESLEKERSADAASIDMYYRTKSKKTESLEISPAEERNKKKNDYSNEENQKERKKSSYEETLEDGVMKEKRLREDSGEEASSLKEKKSSELEIDPPSKKRKTSLDAEEEIIPLFKKNNHSQSPDAEKENKNKGFTEELGGNLKGKSSFEETFEDEFAAKEKKEYDNSEIAKKKEKKVELVLAPAGEKKRTSEDEENKTKDPHEGAVDHLDGNMIGNEGTVEKIRERMEGRSQYEEAGNEKSPDVFQEEKKNSKLDQDQDERNKDSSLLNPEEEKIKKGNDNSLTPHEKEKDPRKKDADLELEKGKNKDNKKDEDLNEDNLRTKSLQKLNAEEKNKNIDKTEALESEVDESQTNSQKKQEEKNKKKTHESSVDKIDTFYRGGDAKKNTPHSWENLLDKKNPLDLLPEKRKREDETMGASEKKDMGEITIDYRKLKAEFDSISSAEKNNLFSKKENHVGKIQSDTDEESSKVIEIDPKSLDFGIEIINLIYQKEIKPPDFFSLLTKKLMTHFHAYAVFYTYKTHSKKFTEIYNSFSSTPEEQGWWENYKKNTTLLEDFQNKAMTTWRSPEVINNGIVWEDVELPSWAESELKTKKVELIFPYFDGIDRMGMALVFFQDGLDSRKADGILTLLEMARTLFLDTIERYQTSPQEEATNPPEEKKEEEKKNVLKLFGNVFGKKKAG